MTTEKQLQLVIRLDIKPEIFGFQIRIAPPLTATRLRFQSIPLSLTQLQINSVTSRLRYGKII